VLDPLSAGTTSFLSKAIVKSAQDYVAQRVKAAAEAQARHETLAAEAQARREQLAADALGRHQRIEHERWLARYEAEAAELRADRESARRRGEEVDRRKLDHYPVAQGPGFLRSSLNLGLGGPENDRLVVLLTPTLSEDTSGQAAAGLRVRVADDLKSFADGRLRTWLIDRPLQWPNHDLYVGDLYDVPALILQISLAQGLLTVRLGGCNLGLQRTEDPKSVYRMRWPTREDWTVEDVDRLNDSGFAGVRFARRVPADAEAFSELNHELASRIIVLCVVAAMDAFYLTRRVGYDELLDDAVRLANLGEDGLSVDPGVDERLLADPGYHHLHRVERRLRRRDVAGARIELRSAMAAIAGVPAADADIEKAVRAAAQSGRLMDHHRAKTLEAIERFPRARWRDRARSLLEQPVAAEVMAEAPVEVAAAASPRLDADHELAESRMLTAAQISKRLNSPALVRRNETGRERT
jgi:hypothetical protein